MGSAGSGSFGTYRIGNRQPIDGTESGNRNLGDGTGGRAGEVECPAIINNIRLEDVATSDYYNNHHSLPSIGDSVNLNDTIYKGRLVVKITSTDEVLGNLPTRHNYLINCIKKGWQYTGDVVASGTTPVPFIVVTLHA